MIGSTRVARRAGSQQARSATAASSWRPAEDPETLAGYLGHDGAKASHQGKGNGYPGDEPDRHEGRPGVQD